MSLSATLPPGVLVVRRGPGGNCSSVGSAVEIVFLSTTVGAAVLAAVAAALVPPETREEGPPEQDAAKPPEHEAP